MSFTDATENLALTYLFTGNSVTRPTSWTVGLYTAAPNDDGTGGTEVSGGSYARQSIAFTVSANTASNTADVTFPTASADWGSLTHAVVFSAAGMEAIVPITPAKSVTSGDDFLIPAGGLTITQS